jgi:hypothetical protein
MTINIPRAVFAAFFGLVSTSYFGWNLSPKSEAELICDGITILIAALSFEMKP